MLSVLIRSISVNLMMMVWFFMSLLTLFKSYREYGRVIIKSSTQWSAIQSWDEFGLQQDSNSGSCNPKSTVLTTLPPRPFYENLTWYSLVFFGFLVVSVSLVLPALSIFELLVVSTTWDGNMSETIKCSVCLYVELFHPWVYQMDYSVSSLQIRVSVKNQ